MKYYIKSGTLYQKENSKPLAVIRSSFRQNIKKISTPDHTEPFFTVQRSEQTPSANTVLYELQNSDHLTILKANPSYEPEENPAEHGWPVSHMPAVRHAVVSRHNESYDLRMNSTLSYSMDSKDGKEVFSMQHHGVSGGWDMEADPSLTPNEICGLYLFCRFLEQENEFHIL